MLIEFLVPPRRVLSAFLDNAVRKSLEPMRVARTGYSLLCAGSNSNDTVIETVTNYLLRTQQKDGGWSDPEETAWATGFLSQAYGAESKPVEMAVNWLQRARYPNGGWGRHPRDQVRIPTTALVITLVPSVATENDYAWVSQEWERDLARPVHLSYKGGFYLLTACHDQELVDHSLVDKTIEYLAEDQNDDGGFGPWRDHPIGSDPWSTGVVLWGLSQWKDHLDENVFIKALNWLKLTQLPSGYWPYHYLDEGTSYALIGAVSALKALGKSN